MSRGGLALLALLAAAGLLAAAWKLIAEPPAAGRGSHAARAIEESGRGGTAPPKARPARTPARLPAAVLTKKEWETASALASGWGKRLRAGDAAPAAAVERALAGGDPVAELAALQSLGLVLRLPGEAGSRERWRPLLLPLLHARQPEVRWSALQELVRVGVRAGDLPVLLACARDPAPPVRANAAVALRAAAGPNPDPETRAAVLALLDDTHPEVVARTLQAFGRTELGPEYRERLLALARRPELAPDVIREGLAPLRNKSDAVVDLLMERMRDPDPRIGDAAAQALLGGVPETRRALLADRCARLLESHPGLRLERDCLRLLARHGTAAHEAALDRFAASPAFPARLRRELERTQAAIRNRR